MAPAARPRPVQPFGAAIRSRREALEFTDVKFAGEVGASVDAVRRWERGTHRPQVRYHASLARALGLTVEELTQLLDTGKLLTVVADRIAESVSTEAVHEASERRIDESDAAAASVLEVGLRKGYAASPEWNRSFDRWLRLRHHSERT